MDGLGLNFAALTKSYRRSIEVTEAELAEDLGIPLQELQEIEAGKKRPSLELAQQLAAYLGLDQGSAMVYIVSADLLPPAIIAPLRHLPDLAKLLGYLSDLLVLQEIGKDFTNGLHTMSEFLADLACQIEWSGDKI